MLAPELRYSMGRTNIGHDCLKLIDFIQFLFVLGGVETARIRDINSLLDYNPAPFFTDS